MWPENQNQKKKETALSQTSTVNEGFRKTPSNPTGTPPYCLGPPTCGLSKGGFTSFHPLPVQAWVWLPQGLCP